MAIDFNGPAPNSADFSASASGQATTTLNGKIIRFFSGAPNPQTDPIGFDPDTVTTILSPAALPTNRTGGPTTAMLTVDSTSWTPISIRDVNLDLLNGATPDFAFDSIVLEIETDVPGFFDPDSNIKIDVVGEFASAIFYQNAGAASFGAGNTYAIPGIIFGAIDVNFDVDIAGGSLLVQTGLGTQSFEFPFTLTGALGVDTTDAANPVFAFDGVATEDFTLANLSTIFAVSSLGAIINMTLDVGGRGDLALDYHLEDTAQVPEPGAFVLFFIGLLGLAPHVRRRLRSR